MDDPEDDVDDPDEEAEKKATALSISFCHTA